jgi:hypothetical protein
MSGEGISLRGFDGKSAGWLFTTLGFVVAGGLMVLWVLSPLLPLLRNDAAYLCDVDTQYRPVSPIPYERLETSGEISWFPIGLRCSFWAGSGLPRVTNEIDWLSTQIAAVGFVLIIASPAVLLWLYLRETR